MRTDQMMHLKNAIESARINSAFVEWVDEDGQRKVVVGVGPREGEPGPVAFLSSGCYVALDEAVTSDFRLVTPAVPFDCPGRLCQTCTLAPLCHQRANAAAPADPAAAIETGTGAAYGPERCPVPAAEPVELGEPVKQRVFYPDDEDTGEHDTGEHDTGEYPAVQ